MKPFASLLLLLAVVSHSAQAAEVKVFTATFLPAVELNGVNATVYYINRPDLIMSELGNFQTYEKQSAQEVATNVLASEKGRKMLADLKQSFNGVFIAWSHSIKRLPAILVDDKYLVYGVFDVAVAEQYITQHRAEEL